MIHENLLLIMALFFAMTLLYLLSQKLKISYPILLVIGGLGISFIPGVPVINIDPDLVFLSSEPYPFKEEDAFEIGRFTHHAKTVFVDGEMFSWYGSRILKAFAYFKKLHERIG